MRRTVGPELHFMSAAHTSTTLSARPCLPRACGPAVEQALRRCDRKNYVDADIPHAYIYQACAVATAFNQRPAAAGQVTRVLACPTLLPHCHLYSVLSNAGFAPAHWLPRDHLCAAHAWQAAVGANASCRCCCCCRRCCCCCRRAAAVAVAADLALQAHPRYVCFPTCSATCLELLREHLKPGARVLDVGSGAPAMPLL